jgi:hypothetical protein
VPVRAIKRKQGYWDQPFGIRNKKKKKILDGDMEREWPGG